MCILDILRHLPRSLFSDAQMDIISWGLRVFGIDDIPSVDVLKELDAELQEIYGINSIQYEGALGHVYYVNNLEEIIAQVLSTGLYLY
jgi:hypothetical protein